MLRNTFAAWAAGFFDGEGYVSLWQKKAKGGASVLSYYMRVGVNQVDMRPLLLIQHQWGGQIRPHNYNHPVWQDSHNWELSRKALIKRFLSDIEPFLIVKREQVHVMLEYIDIPHKRQVPATRLAVVQKMADLKRRGVA